MTAAIDITTEQRKTLLMLLHRFIPGVAVWAYGSRVKWTARPNSDLDLVTFTTPSQRQLVSKLKEALEESNIPFLVDLHVWDDVPEKFRGNIKKEYVVLQEAKQPEEVSGMAGDWKSASIQDVVQKVAMGPFGSSIKVDTFVPEGIPVISGQHLRGRRLDDLAYNFISLEHADKLANANVKRGDVVFTHAGNIGQVAYIPESSKYERYVISQRQFYLRPNTEMVLPEFIVYFFTSDEGQHKLLANTSSSGVPSIAQPVTYLRTIQIPLPPIPEQRAIAHILGTLDDKIELNQRMNETLEAMARALFKSWFVDFDPVRAKAEGRDTGLPKHIAELFPDSFDDSELGDIPKGWEVKKLGDLLELAYGKALKAGDRQDGNVPVYGSNGQVGWHDERLVAGPGIVVGRKGNPGIVTWVPTDFFPIDTTFYVVPKANCQTLEFLFHILRTHDLASLGADSAVPGLNRNLVYMSDQLLPPAPLLEQFGHIANRLSRRVNCGNEESRSLAALRDTLLPRLISGELRVATLL